LKIRIKNIIGDMSTFDDALARMKSLYTYGQELNEGNTIKAHTLEYKKKGADGRFYGIVRECSHYYIKTAQEGRENIAENYDYIGGFNNKKHYEYDSYNNALKNLELKLASINEACEAKVNISTLDPFRKDDLIVEATDEMKDMIARQRQIMYNTAMLMNESIEIGASHKDNTVMYDGANPEAPKGEGKEGVYTEDPKFTDDAFETTNAKPEQQSEPFEEKPKEGEDQLKEGCGCGQKNCPKCGKLKEECSCEDWGSCGLPSDGQAGVGEADTDHNNNPFNQNVNESEEDDVDVTADVDTEDGEGTDDVDVDLDLGLDDNEGDAAADDVQVDLGTDDEGDAEIDVTSDETGDDDIMAKIEELQAQLDALKAQAGMDTDTPDLDDDTTDMGDLDTDVTADIDTDVTDNGEVTDTDVDVTTDVEGNEGDDTFDTDDDNDDEGLEECGDGTMTPDMMYEAKRALQEKINRIAYRMIKENELHDWGKHPGYQKKPFTTPPTGSDEFDGNRDWNDKSVASEKPFGTEIGDSFPFNDLVDKVVKDVMLELNKKKVK